MAETSKGNQMEKIKVFLSDPQILFREGIHFTLSGEEDFDVVGESTSNEEALVAIEGNTPNLAIINMRNGKVDGPEATRRIRRNLPSVSVVLVIENEDDAQLFLALKSGASACINKAVDPDVLIDLARAIAKGSQPIAEVLLRPGVAALARAEFEALLKLGDQLQDLLAHLSQRESEVIKRLAEGDTLAQVAARVGGNEESVRQQTRTIVQKLVANDQARAMIEAIQKSLPAIFAGNMPGKPSAEYITRSEFLEFKDNLMQSLKTLAGELSPKR